MACTTCGKGNSNRRVVERTMKSNTYNPKSNDFTLMFYVGDESEELSNVENLFYTGLVNGEQYFVHKEDVSASYWTNELMDEIPEEVISDEAY